MMTKYISVRHMNYWYGVYGLEPCLDNVEFSVYNDENKNDFFFHFDLYNLNAIDEITACDVCDEDFTWHIQTSTQKMISEKLGFAPMWQYYGEDIFDFGLKLNLKDERGSDPYYLGICVNGRASFVPFNLEEVAKAIIKKYFDIETELCFIDECCYEQAKEAYFADVNYANPMLHQDRENFK